MVKFSKELEAQLIPEWKDAFVNYWLLKKHVKRIKRSRLSTASLSSPVAAPGSRLFSPLRRLARAITSSLSVPSTNPDFLDVQEERRENDEEALNEEDLSDLSSPGDEIKEFRARLNAELGKVNEFYKAKEGEFVERGQVLNSQLQILLQLKQFLRDRRRNDPPSPLSTSSISRDLEYSESTVASDDPATEDYPADNDDDVVVLSPERSSEHSTRWSQVIKKKGRARVAGMRIKIPATTPTRAIAAFTSKLWEDVVSNDNPKKEIRGDYVTRKKIQYAEKMIRGAFVELYRGLGLLKTYSSLNMTAFRKILKKFDKVSNQCVFHETYNSAVARSYFNSSDKVLRLGDEVESIFTKHFTDDDRKKAMQFLRPRQRKPSHVITFFVGLFTGSFAALFCVYAFLANLYGTLTPTREGGYMETVYPIFSMFALISLHIFMYGCNLYMWKKYRINYHFIFEFSPNTALKHRDAFLIATSCITMVVAAMVLHLFLRSTGFSSSNVDAVPGILLLFFIVMLVCPFNVFYRSSRYYFLRTLRNIICSPCYKVTMVDVYMADQLTSQVPLLRHMEFTACYYLTASFKTQQYRICTSNKIYKELAYIISFMPYYWRAMQCGRKWLNEGDRKNLANLGKYVSALLAALAKLTYAIRPTPMWRSFSIVTFLVATVYQLYWDFCEDWGLFRKKSRNRWLRDELVLNKKIYWFSIGLNILLRVVWIVSVFPFDIGRVKHVLLDFLLASLEIVRRGHWNFYRLENEHLDNVGNLKAVKAVPLPFRDLDSDD